MIAPLEVLRAFVSTRWRSRRWQSRAAFERWQHKAVTTWLSNSPNKVGFYNKQPTTLQDLPITDKAVLMSRFDQFNTHALTVQQAWDIQNSGGRLGDLTVGASTGTSGNRGLFIISETEKLRWLGTIVAKTMADLIWKRQRVAIILPQDTGLYSSANRLSFIQLRTFSVLTPASQWRAELEAFDPTVIVAPPKMLRLFAELDYAIRPRRVFSAAETLDRVDADIANAFFDQPIRQIYMATEGLFAVSCGHGTLHLAEDCVAFEFEPVEGGLVAPLVTSFRRDTQVMARYRMNDVLRLSDAPCPCGSPLRAVAEIVGRMDDVFEFEGGVRITPDVLRNAVLDADRTIDDFRLTLLQSGQVLLALPRSVPPDVADRAADGVRALMVSFGAQADVVVEARDLAPDINRKLRRVQNQRRPHG